MNRYQITIRSEENFSEKASFVTSYFKVLTVSVVVFVVLIVSSLFMWSYIFDNYINADAHRKQSEQNLDIVRTSKLIDELEHQLEIKDQFINTFKLYLGKHDSLPPEINLTEEQVSSPYVEELIEPVKEAIGNHNLAEMYFIPPVNGYSVTRSFDYAKGHLGADIVAKAGEPILCIAAGTVIFSSWTDEFGYVIGVQHSDNLTSFYKHNSVILKNVGDIVLAGDAIAILGNSGVLSSGPHLHFEIWHNGHALNPEHYISFEK